MKKPTSITTKLLKISLYLLGLFLFQEVVLRICFPIPELSNFDRINYMKLDANVKRYAHLRNQTWYWVSLPDTNYHFQHYMNGYGFRDEEWPVERSDKKRLLFVGDSFVEGVMAEQDETLPNGFERAAGEGQYEVMNGGMMGSGLSSYLQLVADAAPVFQPDYIFLCISANDLSPKAPITPQFYLSPEYFNPYRPRLLEVIEQLQNKSPIQFRFGSSSKSYLPTIASPSNPWRTKEAQLKEHTTPEMAEHMKNGTYSPFRTNNLFNEERFFKQPPNLGETLGFFQYTCNQYKIKPVVVYIPSRNLTTNYYLPFEREHCLKKCPEDMDLTQPEYQLHQQVLELKCQQLGIPFINLTPIIRAEESKGNHLYWDHDDHMRGKGYLLMGKAVYEQWRKYR